MNRITVEEIISLLRNDTQIQIYVLGIHKTYEFDINHIPDEFLYCKIYFIDDPYNKSKPQPLCININGKEEFDNIPELIETFKDYEV